MFPKLDKFIIDTGRSSFIL